MKYGKLDSFYKISSKKLKTLSRNLQSQCDSLQKLYIFFFILDKQREKDEGMGKGILIVREKNE